MENQESRAEIMLGVDTHLDIHVGVVMDTAGRVLDPYPLAQRGSIGSALRNQPTSSLVWQDSKASTQSWWRSPGQQRAVDHCNGSHAK